MSDVEAEIDALSTAIRCHKRATRWIIDNASSDVIGPVYNDQKRAGDYLRERLRTLYTLAGVPAKDWDAELLT